MTLQKRDKPTHLIQLLNVRCVVIKMNASKP